MDTIKLKRATKSVANASTKVLEKDEVLVVTPDSGSGKGKCQLKFGDGVTAAKSLPVAIDGENADEMKVSTFTTASDENPVLNAGETIKVLLGKIKKKFTYYENLIGNVKTVTNLFGSTDAKTVAQGLQNLVNTKFNKSDLYDGTDSTSLALGATANAVRKVNEKTDNNAKSITALNSNLVPQIYREQIVSSGLLNNAGAVLVKTGRVCTIWGGFTVKEGQSIINVDLFNISSTGVLPLADTTFSLSSFDGSGGIGVLNNDGKIIFAMQNPGTQEWRFNFSFVSVK